MARFSIKSESFVERLFERFKLEKAVESRQ